MVLTGHGGVENLEYWTDWPVPVPGPDDVLIRVAACGMNNTDINTRTGWYSKSVTSATSGEGYASFNADDPTWGGAPIGLPRIQGADVCGHVVATGKDVDATLMGCRVITDNWVRDDTAPDDISKAKYYGSERDGGYAEFTTIPARNVGVITNDMTDAELASFSCSYTTAEGMLTRALVTGTDTVLITGASGGVGSALIQLARLRGARTVALASEAKHDDIRALGADEVLPRTPKTLPRVSVVADIVGGPQFCELIEALKPGGRYICSGAIAGPIVDLDLRTFYLNDLTFSGSTVVPPAVFQTVLGHINAKRLKPLVAATYPLAELHKAQAAFVEKRHIGNIVVIP